MNNQQNKAFEGFSGLISAVTEQRKNWLGHFQPNGGPHLLEDQIRSAFINCAVANKQCVYEDIVRFPPWDDHLVVRDEVIAKIDELFEHKLYDNLHAEDMCKIYHTDTSCIIFESMGEKDIKIVVLSLSLDAIKKTISWLIHNEDSKGDK